MPSINLTLPGGSYTITIEPGVLARLGTIAAAAAPAPSALLVVDANVAATHGVIAADSLRAAGYALSTVSLDASERAKDLDTVRRLYEAMLQAKLERSSPVIALGGGVIGDAAGFAAATFMRGLSLVQAPTTLLAMVDAAIGGKTGVNFALPRDGSGAGGGLVKNLIGAFWQPRAVVADPRVLRTLSLREVRCGLAECVKHALIADESLLDFIDARLDGILQRDDRVLTDLIERCARIKAAIVQMDEREAGRRALLNLGHTFAHAIEPREELDLKHGEAVSIGLCAAMGCAAALGRVDPSQQNRLADLLHRIGLPTRMRLRLPMEGLISAMAHDKKVARGELVLILPRRSGGPEIVAGVPRSAIEAGWSAVLGA